MQTDSFTVLVGPDQYAYKVPEARLTMHSPVFERMCSAPFLESTQRVIELPEEDPVVFDDFFDWMHSSKPQVDFSKGPGAIFDLAIFAEKYQICHLKNQISDILRKEWEKQKLKSELVDHVYRNVPDGAVLRQLCSWILRMKGASCAIQWAPLEFYKDYETVFTSHADLGRNFFKWTIIGEPKACSFHDHSNITNPVVPKGNVCPYSDIHFLVPQSEAPRGVEYRALKKQEKNP